jgi:hypothetical protein
MNLFKLFFIIFFLSVTGNAVQSAFAVTESELQEIRYAKSMVAYNNQEYDKALKFITQNMHPKKTHVPSFELLADIHEKKQNYIKAIRVYFFLMKHYQAHEYIKLKLNDDFTKNVSQLEKPSAKVMDYIFKVANLYLSTHDQLKEKYQKQKEFKKENPKSASARERIIPKATVKIELQSEEEKEELALLDVLRTSEKYFKICDHYKYSEAMTLFMLGIVEKRRNNIFTSRELFKQAYAKQTEEGEQTSQADNDLKQLMEFYIGDALIQEGQRELATRFFMNLTNDGVDTSLQNYSKFYLDSLTKSSLYFTVGGGVGYDTNPFSQDPRKVSSAEYTKADTYLTKEVAAYYTSDQSNDWSWTTNAGFSDRTYNNPDYDAADSRILSLAGDLRYFYLPSHIRRVGFGFYQFQTKQSDSTEFSNFSSSLNITPAIDWYTSGGILTLSLPIKLVSFAAESGGAQTTESIGTLSYTSWGKSKWFSPTYTIGYGATSTNRVVSNSQNLRASFYNQMTPNSENNIFAGLSYSNDIAEKASETSSSIDVSLLWLKDLSSILRGLTLRTKIESTLTETGETSVSKVRQHRYSTGLQLTF